MRQSLIQEISRTLHKASAFISIKVKTWLKTLRIKIVSILLRVGGKYVKIKVNSYGRIGNNLQQLLLAKYHQQIFGCAIEIDNSLRQAYAEMGAPSGYLWLYEPSQNKSNKYLYTITTDLFFFENHKPLWKNTYIDSRMFLNAIPYLLKPLKEQLSQRNHLTIKRLADDDNTLYLHLRAGDIANLESKEYITNPMSYYEWLASKSNAFCVVTEPNCSHPLLGSICDALGTKRIISSPTAINDFYILASCKRMATSGVGSFAVGAALLNERLESITFSNAYRTEHLNPTMIQDHTHKSEYKINEAFFKEWANSDPKERLKLLFRY